MSLIDKVKAKPKGSKAIADKARKPAAAPVAAPSKAASPDLTKPLADLARGRIGAGNHERVKKEKGEAVNYLMWVGTGAAREGGGGGDGGGNGYPTIEHFTKEASLMGVSKRLNAVTEHLIPGKTRIYLAHPRLYETALRWLSADAEVRGIRVPKISRIKAIRECGDKVLKAEAIADKAARKARLRDLASEYGSEAHRLYVRDERWNKIVGTSDPKVFVEEAGKFAHALREWGPAVFAYFTVERLEYIQPSGEKDLPPQVKRLVDKGICKVIPESEEAKARVIVGSRGCGWRKPGGVYAVAYQEATKVIDPDAPRSKGKRGSLTSAGPLWMATDPTPIPGVDYYRGLRSIPDDLAVILEMEMELGQGGE